MSTCSKMKNPDGPHSSSFPSHKP